MIRLNNVRLPLDYTDDTIRKKVSRELKIDKSAIQGVALFRRSVDARKKEQIHFLCSVDVTLNGKEDLILKRCKANCFFYTTLIKQSFKVFLISVWLCVFWKKVCMVCVNFVIRHM